MKIISGYKDYYDYLSGIYGIDPLVVLDRRQGGKAQAPSNGSHVTLHICDMVYEGWYIDHHYYWCNEVLPIAPSGSPQSRYDRYDRYLKDPDKPRVLMIDKRYQSDGYVTIKPYPSAGKVNTLQQCPILFNYQRRSEKRYPILKDLGIQSILPPQDIYLSLTDWLSPKDNNVDTRTDKDKILTNGFDIKTSFRHG